MEVGIVEGLEVDREEHQEVGVEEGVGVSLSHYPGNLRGRKQTFLLGLHTESNIDG